MTEITYKSLKEFVVPTKLIDSQNPAIIAKAGELTTNVVQVEDKAKYIFYFVRDNIHYNFRAKFDEEEYLASNILKKARGFCTQKAILFCALARSCGIPAGIHFYDIVDYTLPKRIVKIMRTRTLYHHGITALYLNGNWYKYDATLDIHMMKKNHLYPVEFNPNKNCLMNKKTPSDGRHIEYVRDHGLFTDVSFEEIMSWFKQGYPHLL